MKSMGSKVCLLFLLFLFQSASADVPPVESIRVIYGDDNRLDVYQEQEDTWKNRAMSTVALLQSSKLTAIANGYNLKTANYGTSQGLCKSEPFYDQVTAAFCSGSLIAPDIVMSAGHCVRTLSACKTTKFVFNFAYKAMGMDPNFAANEDVYSCKELIYSEVDATTKSDFSLIRLDRQVTGRMSLPVRQSGDVSVDDPLVVIGHPSGLPTKIASGAHVRSTAPQTYFVANLDTYGGNSGSAVFNEETGLIEGILVRGEVDFKTVGSCSVSNICSSTGCRGEDVTRVKQIFSHVDMNELAPVPLPAPEPVPAPDAPNTFN